MCWELYDSLPEVVLTNILINIIQRFRKSSELGEIEPNGLHRDHPPASRIFYNCIKIPVRSPAVGKIMGGKYVHSKN